MNDEVLSLLCISAYNHYLSTLVGNPAPTVRAALDKMSHPQPGDWVIETSTIWDRARDRDRFGRLLRTAAEPMWTPEQWAEGGGGADPIPLERIFYIRTADGREYRWRNASFIAIPDGIRAWEAAAA